MSNWPRPTLQDLDSAPKGGDLGYLSRGAQKELKPVEDAAFALKAGAVSGIVESDFGFHLVKLDEIRAASPRPFEQVKTAIEEELKKSGVSKKRFAEMADGFTNLVYERPDNLKPVAERYN